MKLTTSQQDMVNRAYGDNPMRTHDSRRIYSDDYYRENLSDFPICDVYGSGEHRTARSLEKMGLGRVFYIRPLEPAFFKLVGSKGEALAGLIGSDGNMV